MQKPSILRETSNPTRHLPTILWWYVSGGLAHNYLQSLFITGMTSNFFYEDRLDIVTNGFNVQILVEKSYFPLFNLPTK